MNKYFMGRALLWTIHLFCFPIYLIASFFWFFGVLFVAIGKKAARTIKMKRIFEDIMYN